MVGISDGHLRSDSIRLRSGLALASIAASIVTSGEAAIAAGDYAAT